MLFKFKFGIVVRAKGRQDMVDHKSFQDHLEAQKLAPPKIQLLLKQAYEFKKLRDEGLSLSEIAKREGISRPRVCQILNLLKLPAKMQRKILALPPGFYRGEWTENWLRRLKNKHPEK